MKSLINLQKSTLDHGTRKYRINNGSITPFDLSKEYQYNVNNKKGNVPYKNSGWLLNDFCNHLSEKNSRVFIELAKQGKFIIMIEENKTKKVFSLSLSYYFIEKVLECLTESGMGIVLVAGNSLSNKKGLQYRTELIKSKNIDTIIKVPKTNSTSKKDLHIMILKRNVQAIKFLTIDDKKYLQDDDFKKINSKIAANYFNNENSRVDINRILANNSNLDPKEYI